MDQDEGQTTRPRLPLRPFIVAGAGFTLLIALLSFHRVAGTDVWYYMAAARWMLDHSQVPRHNLFMYTDPTYPWVAHALLAQLAFLLIYRVAGMVGLQVFVAVAYAVRFGVVLWLWWRMGVGMRLALIPFLLALLLPVGRYTPRPELCTGMLLAVTAALVLVWREFGGRWIWVLPALVVLWVNTHGGVSYGVGFVLIFAAGETLQMGLARVWPAVGRWALPVRRWRTLALVSGCSAGALLLNPYGLGWFRTISPTQIRFMTSLINEWRPMLEPGLDTKVPLAVAFVFLAVAWLSFAFRRSPHLGSLAVAGVFTALPFTSLRHLPMSGLVLLALMAWNLRHAAWPRFLSPLAPAAPAASRALTTGGLVLGLAVLGFALNIPFFWWLGAQQPLGLGIDPEVHPVGGERFIQEQSIAGRMFHEWWYSGYLAWTRYPQRAAFMDWIEAYGPEVAGQYKEIATTGPHAQALIEQWGIEYFFMQSPAPSYRASGKRDIHWLLSESPDWGLVYWDAISVIYLRRTPENARLLERFEYKYLDPLDPLSPANREHPAQVARELRRAVAANPHSAPLRAQAGRIYLQLGWTDRAIEEFRQATRLNASFAPAYTGLGLAYLANRDLEAASHMFGKAAWRAPRDPWAHRGLAQVAQARGDWRAAVREWSKVIRRSPATPGDRVALALAYEAQGDARRAARAWRSLLAVGADPETAALARTRLRALSAPDQPGR